MTGSDILRVNYCWTIGLRSL